MSEMLRILWQILSPIYIIILSGYLIQKKFKLSLQPLTKVQLYLFIPALIFIKIATSQLDSGLVFRIISFTVILFFSLMALSFLISKILGLGRKKEKAFMNAVILRNQGNFGIPLMSLLFTGAMGEYAMSVHMIVLFATNILLNTFGLYNASSGSYTRREAMIKVLRMPILYVVALGFMFKAFSLTIPAPIHESLDIMGNAVVPLALFTLGAQLANTKLALTDRSLPLATAMRLILSPLLAWLMTIAFGFTGIIAQVLIIGAAAPTAVNSVILAMEFDGDADYASETVLLTTLLCAVTVTITIHLVGQ